VEAPPGKTLAALEAFGATAADGEGGATGSLGRPQHQHVATAGAWATINANEYDSYNTYGVLWTLQTLTSYYNGQAVAQTPTPSDHTQKMYLIANLAVGGGWPGNVAGENATMKIDYIRPFSSDFSIPAVARQTISSPDGGGFPLYSATSAPPSELHSLVGHFRALTLTSPTHIP
jgi:beta-glucanase (GH16 family)